MGWQSDTAGYCVLAQYNLVADKEGALQVVPRRSLLIKHTQLRCWPLEKNVVSVFELRASLVGRTHPWLEGARYLSSCTVKVVMAQSPQWSLYINV